MLLLLEYALAQWCWDAWFIHPRCFSADKWGTTHVPGPPVEGSRFNTCCVVKTGFGLLFRSRLWWTRSTLGSLDYSTCVPLHNFLFLDFTFLYSCPSFCHLCPLIARITSSAFVSVLPHLYPNLVALISLSRYSWLYMLFLVGYLDSAGFAWLYSQ